MDEEGVNVTTKEKNVTPGVTTEEKPAEPEKKAVDPYKESIE